MRRPCRCGEVPPYACAACVVQNYTNEMKLALGTKVWKGTTQMFRNGLRELLLMRGEPGAELFTLKAYRAGRATQLAEQGKGRQSILNAGEWSGNAALSYLDADRIDAATFLKAAFEGSTEDEGT